MKTGFKSNLKDNVAAATVLTAALIAIMGSIVTSNDARADRALPAPVQKMEVQRLATMLITAPRIQQITMLETMVVTASRDAEEAPKFLVASK